MPATASSVPATERVVTRDEPPEADSEGRSPTDAGGRSVAIGVVLALVIGGLAALMYATHRDGHWWGDDWALYIRQAQSLIDGDPATVAAENRFTVEASLGPPFSPPLYPWGFPALLAPFVAVVGADVDRLTIVPVLSATVFACCWFDLVRRRLGTIAGFAALAAVPISPLLLGWTELIQSEWPFLAVTAFGLVVIDRVVAADRLVGVHARLGPLLLLGICATAAFSIRREGLAMVTAIAAAQLVIVVPMRSGWVARHRRLASAQLIAPHAAALATVGLVQWLLPDTLVPRYDGTTIANVWRLVDDHVEHLAEVIGIKRPWDTDPVVLGSTVLGWIAVGAFIVGAIVGLVVAVSIRRRRDAHLAAYAVVAFVIGASFRVALNRYVCTVAPILLLLALTAVRVGIERGRSSQRRVVAAIAVASAVLLAIGAGNVANANVRLDRAQEWADTGRIEWGPTHPDAVEMFDAVRRLSEADDVVAAPKARAMVLETGRWAIQVDDSRPIPEDVDVALVVVEHDAELLEELTSPSAPYELQWANGRFAILRPDDQRSSSASASTNGDGSSSTASP